MRLVNNTKSTARIGTAVKVDPNDPRSFLYANVNDTRILGICSESRPYREPCDIISSGVTQVYVQANVRRGDAIRYRKSTDGISAGNCAVARPTDAPYLLIGTTLESGKGLVRCELNLSYITSGAAQSSITTVTSSPYTITETDSLIVVNSASAVTVIAPIATGSGRTIQIASIGAGVVTIDPTGSSTIDGETTQAITQWDTIVIRDYVSNKFKIV